MATTPACFNTDLLDYGAKRPDVMAIAEKKAKGIVVDFAFRLTGVWNADCSQLEITGGYMYCPVGVPIYLRSKDIFSPIFYGTPQQGKADTVKITHSTWTLNPKVKWGALLDYFKKFRCNMAATALLTDGEFLLAQGEDFRKMKEQQRRECEVEMKQVVEVLKREAVEKDHSAIKALVFAEDIGVLCHLFGFVDKDEAPTGYELVFPESDVMKLPHDGILNLATDAKDHTWKLCIPKNQYGLPPLTSKRLALMKIAFGETETKIEGAERLLSMVDLIRETIWSGEGSATAIHFVDRYDLLPILREHFGMVYSPTLNLLTESSVVRLERELAMAVREILVTARNNRCVNLPPLETRGLMTTQKTRPCLEQMQFIGKLFQKGTGIFCLDGSPGSGKSESIAFLPKLFRGKIIKAGAFQGKNVASLMQVLKHADTLHMMLLEHANTCPKITKKHDQVCPMKGVHILVVEEAGMVSLPLMTMLMSMVASCGSDILLVLLVGDANQLPPIGLGQPFVQLMKFFAPHGLARTYVTNHRVHSGARVIASNCALIKKGDSNLEWNNTNFVMIPCDRSEIREKVQELTKDMPPEETMVITRTNAVCKELCNIMDISVGKKFCITQNDREREYDLHTNEALFCLGIRDYTMEEYSTTTPKRRRLKQALTVREQLEDPAKAAALYVMMTKLETLWELDERSGPSSVLTRLQPNHVRVIKARVIDHPHGLIKYILFDSWVKENARSTEVMTVNRAIGAGATNVLFVMPFDSEFETRARAYTAVSRAKRRFFFLGNEFAFEAAIKRDPPRPYSLLLRELQEHLWDIF